MHFLYLSSDKMGEGDAELGRRLLVTFLEKLAASDVRVDVVGCVNNGVLLTTGESAALPSLRALQEKGARIVSCSTCLEYHGRGNALLIGEVGSMDGTVAIMATAERIIKP